MTTTAMTTAEWVRSRIDMGQVTKYRVNGRLFLDDAAIESALRSAPPPDPVRIREIIAKARAIQTLDVAETAALLQVRDGPLWEEMKAAAAAIKRTVYDNRIVTFAPLYLSNVCVNNCLYCGLRCSNTDIRRRRLDMAAIRAETEILAGTIGHKRLIVVFGEHPDSGLEYMMAAIRTIYDVTVKTRRGVGQIRRVNVNAAPLRIEELKTLHEAGLGTYQVFQETYHPATYARVHPARTLKGHFDWRLTCMHRALDAGVDDVGIGALFGLYDWRFEVLGLLAHARELERAFGIGPHTISFPRLEPAANTPFVDQVRTRVSDAEFERAVVVLRLAVPYTGMIVTAREGPAMRRRLIPLGCTQTDASSRIGIGAYQEARETGAAPSEQFMLGDTRSLDDLVRELAGMGYITSFCTAGYRCGRTGKCIMDLLRSGQEGKFCKLNAILTFREWLDDFASTETRAAGEPLIRREIEEVRVRQPAVFEAFLKMYDRVAAGERDVYF